MGRLPTLQRVSYSVGHVLNDLCAACWFSYLLLYLQNVQKLSGTQAGAVLFAGQLADALATPLVGLGSDATSVGLPRLGLGRRKVWNAGGVLVVAVSFFFLFGICVPCEVAPPGNPPSAVVKTATFATAAALFNFGWAAVQVSHMAMVPELTTDEGERVLLNSARYAFTVLSNLAVFLSFLTLISVAGGEEAKFEPQLYTRLTLVVLVIGGTCSLIFLAGTKEAQGKGKAAVAAYALLLEGLPRPPPSSKRKEVMTWRDWVVATPFYQVMVVYAMVRLAVNVSQVYLTFYISDTLEMEAQALAVVPLLSYVAQLVATLSMKSLAPRLGRMRTLTAGGLLTAGACGIMLFLTPSVAALVYPTAILLGLGCASAMVVSVSLEGDLVGPNTESGAFVYGAMSFADKLVNGIVVLSIQGVGDERAPPGSPTRASFIRYVTALVPLAAAVLASVVGATINFPKELQGTGGGAISAARALLPKRPGMTRGPSMYAGGVGGAGSKPGFSRGWSVLNVAANAAMDHSGEGGEEMGIAFVSSGGGR